MMQKYAYTPTCRRNFVLRYFGDPAARGECGGCDNCLGTHKKNGRGSSAPKPAKRDRSKSTRRGQGSAEAAGEQPALEPRDAALFTALKRLRSTIAAADKVPAYVVCSDRTLAEIAARRPRSRATLSSVNGMGPSRVDKYGDRLLEVVRNVTDTEAA
jgi:ATP-dependent DNA helicase RecQ